MNIEIFNKVKENNEEIFKVLERTKHMIVRAKAE